MTNIQKQCFLAALGYYPYQEIDGDWGPLSRQATEAFQRDYLLTVDGVFGPETQQRIREVIATGEEPQQAQEDTTADWWSGIRYFDRSEFACPCGRCGGFPAEPVRQLVELADDVREHFGSPADVSSGVRCQAHNDELPNSVPNSCHIAGKAVDFRIRGKTAARVLGYVRTLSGVRYAYAINDAYVHMDVE